MADSRPKASCSKAEVIPSTAAAIADPLDGLLGDVGSDCQQYRIVKNHFDINKETHHFKNST